MNSSPLMSVPGSITSMSLSLEEIYLSIVGIKRDIQVLMNSIPPR